MATIPFSQVSNVVPSVLSAGGSAVDLNAIMLTQNSLAPYGQMQTFSSATNVGAYFGQSSTEYTLATIYFNGFNGCTKTPGQLQFTRYPETAIGAFLNGASVASLGLAGVQALTGTLIVTSNGTQFTSGTINLSTATSLSNAATIIQAAFTSPTFTVTYSSQTGGFIFTSSTTGATSTLTYATGTISTALNLTAATGAILSQGAAVAVPATFMASVLALTQNWATFMTVWESVLTEKEAFATWSNSQGPRYAYVCADSDINALTANNTVTFGNYVQTNSLVGTVAIFGTVSHAAFICGYAASLDFNRLNGRATAAFKSQSGLTAYVTNQSNYTAVVSNGYNTYGAFGSNNPANNVNFFSPGSVSGTWLWLDTYLNQIWLNANLQLAMVTLMTSVNSIPYNTAGYGLVYAASMSPIQAAINFGAIRKGVSLSASQIAQIQYVLGFDASSSITSQGFYLQIVNPSATTRGLRQSPAITLLYSDGESIQQLNMASVVVQ